MYRAWVIRCRGLALFAAFAALSACGPESRFVATEPAGGADLRVIATLQSAGAQVSTINVLAGDEPLTLPLKNAFESGATTQIFVLRYDLATISAAFPALAGRDRAAVASAFSLAFGAPGPGSYALPRTIDGKMYTASVDEDSSGDVEYTEVDFDASAIGEGLVLRLSANVACPPGQGSFRFFNRENAGEVCVLERNDLCEWTGTEQCSAFASMIGRPGRVVEVSEVPGQGLHLDIGGTDRADCTEVQDALKGESRTYSCPADGGSTTRVSVQNIARGRGGVPWVLSPGTAPNLLAPEPRFTRAANGLVYAIEQGGVIRVRRLGQSSETVLGDGPLRVLRGPGDVRNIDLAGAGRLEAISADSSGRHVLVSSTVQPNVTDRDLDASSVDDTFFSLPKPITEATLPAARRRGSVVMGPGQTLYAVIDNGIAVLRATDAGVVLDRETAAGTVVFSAADAPQVFAVRQENQNQDRIVVWTSTGQLYVFKPDTSLALASCNAGEVVAVVEGPKVFRRLDAQRPFQLELLDLGAAERTGGDCDAAPVAYVIPPNSQGDGDEALFLDSETYVADSNRKTIAYRYGSYGGVLDLDSGYSQAARIKQLGFSSALFTQTGSNRFWAVFAPRAEVELNAFLIPVFEGP